MPLLDADAQLVLNPDLARVPGGRPAAFLRGQPDRILELGADTFTLLDRFREPRALAAVLDEPTPEELRAVDRLVEERLLLRAGELPRLEPVRLTPCVPRFAWAPAWTPEGAPPGALVVLGARFDLGTLPQYPRGSAQGPDLVRAASRSLPARSELVSGRMMGYWDVDGQRSLLEGAALFDAGNLDPAPGMSFGAYADRLTAEIRRMREAGARVFVLGGDHSVSLPSLRALDLPAFGVLHIDAHSDLAGIQHADDVHHGNVFRHVAALPGLRHLVQVGGRGLELDRPNLASPAYLNLPLRRLRQLSSGALGDLLHPDLPYYLSIDIDALDPAVAPGTPAPVAEGLGLHETRALLRAATTGRRVLGGDLVEVLPERDRPATTGAAAVQLLLEMMESAWRGR